MSGIDGSSAAGEALPEIPPRFLSHVAAAAVWGVRFGRAGAERHGEVRAGLPAEPVGPVPHPAAEMTGRGAEGRG